MMNEYYQDCECEHEDSVDLADGDKKPVYVQDANYKELVEQALQEVYNEPTAMNAILLDLTKNALERAVVASFVSDSLLKTSLMNSAAVFAAAKTEKQVKDLASLIVDEKGVRRSFGAFKKLSSTVIKNYNSDWLRTEYAASVRTARMASLWAVAQQSADVYPNIEYVRSRAAEPRKKHLTLVGMVRPINDPIWQKYLPPNDWGCLCGFRVTDKEVTELPDPMPVIPLAFQNNAGITGELFTKDHPYFQLVGQQ